MKKLNLSIPTPCHENWDQMTQAEKGKFCGACQKTVVDFTAMNDRQLVDFFKKPKDNVCGRFNDDQLDREILMPRKRIPWIKYFFQFTWPAFIVGLKSCTNNTATTKKVKVELQQIKDNSSELMHTMGMPLPAIIPYEKPLPKPELIKCESFETVDLVSIDSTTEAEDTIQSGAPMEPVIITASPTLKGSLRIRLGGVSAGVRIVNSDTTSAISKKEVEVSEVNFLAYPNPVNAGSMLTVKFPENNIPEKMQLISISGQMIATVEQDISDYATMCNIRIPSHVASGVYFLRLISKEKILNTIKIVVNR